MQTENRGSHVLLDLPKGSTICSSYGFHPMIFECDSTEHVKWELGVDYMHVPPVFQHDRLYMHVKLNDDSVLLKVNRIGKIVSKFEIPTWGSCHWKTFLFDDRNRMFYCCSLEQNGDRKTKLYCFNEHLEILEQMVSIRS